MAQSNPPYGAGPTWTGQAAPPRPGGRVDVHGRGDRTGWGAPGMIAAMSLMIVALLTILATALISVAFREVRIGANEQTHIQALYNADAGLEEAKMRLSPTAPIAARITPVANTAWRVYILSGHTQQQIQGGLDPSYGRSPLGITEDTSQYVFINTVQGANGIQWGWARIQYKVDGAGAIVYLDAVTGNETVTPTQVVGGTTVNNFPVFWVTVRGVAGQAQREVRLELQPIIQSTSTQTDQTTTYVTNPFGQAAHGISAVTLKGNATTDSYKSSLGAYNVNGNKFNNGTIGTDSTAGMAVKLEGNSRVNGNVVVGPSGDPNTVVSTEPNTAITGSKTAEPNAWNVPPSTIPAGVTNSGALSISGNRTVTLSQGVYWFSSISISGNGRLNATGPVKIYVTGNISIQGNGVGTASNTPANMLIYGTADPNNSSNKTNTVTIGGNGAFYGAVYAPEADISINGNAGAAVFGAVTGKTTTLESSALHFDEDLQNLGQTSTVVVTTTNTTTYTTTGTRRHLWREILL